MEFIDQLNSSVNNSTNNLISHLIELLESDLFSVFSKESSTNVHVVFSDDTIVGSGNSATSATFAASSGVSVPDVLVSHF